MKLTEKQKLDTTAQQKIRKLNRCPFCQRGETWKKKTIYHCQKMENITKVQNSYPQSQRINRVDLYSFNPCDGVDMFMCLVLGNEGRAI